MKAIWKMINYFPIPASYKANRKLHEMIIQKEQNKQNKVDTIVNNLKAETDLDFIQELTDEVYATELQRKSSLEAKGAALLGAAAIAVSVISINLVLSDRMWENVTILISGGFFAFAILNLFVAGFSTIPAVRPRSFHFLITKEIEERIAMNKEDLKKRWIAEKLVDTEINSLILIQLSNWLDSATKHFIVGLISLAIGYFALYSPIIWGWIMLVFP